MSSVEGPAQSARPFHILSIGWELSLIHSLTGPVASSTGIRFTHGLVGDASRLADVRARFPGYEFVALSKSRDEPLPAPDYALLASLEAVGVPTIRSMIQGDRVVRHRSEGEALGYATLLAVRIRNAMLDLQPDLVLGSFDSLHASLSLAVARSLGIPWVAMAFTVIPDNLTGFCKGVTPDTLVPIARRVDDALRRQAEEVMHTMRARRQKVLAFRPPASLRERAQQLLQHARNLVRRMLRPRSLGVDRFTYPTASERLADIVRRSTNQLRLPTNRMLAAPPTGRYVLFPMQMAPESSIDTWAPFYHNQLALIAQLHLAMPANVELVVKLHFSDPDNYTRGEILRLMESPRLRIAHPNAPGRAFVEQAALVVAIQGTASLEAALLGKPVLLFGDSPYQHFPRARRATRPDELYQQIRELLDLPPPDDAEIVQAFASYMARYMPGRINDWTREIEPEMAEQLGGCFGSLRAYLEDPVVRASWYEHPPFTSRREKAA